MCKKILFCCLFNLSATVTFTQPYLDVFNFRYTKSPDIGLINRNKKSIDLTYINFSTTLPLVFKNKDAFIFSPYFENWKVKNRDGRQNYYGFILPVSFLKSLNDQWSVLATGILRMNDSSISLQMKRQAGGALVMNYKKNSTLTYKAGFYINREFFGWFFMPLLGIDWQVDNKNVIFGVLPGNLTYQHKISENKFYGVAFRAQTNSYNRSLNHFTRFDENQLGAFLDIYLKKNLVLNLEAGHSILRKIRADQNMDCNCREQYYDFQVNDNLYGKISFAYRISLR